MRVDSIAVVVLSLPLSFEVRGEPFMVLLDDRYQVWLFEVELNRVGVGARCRLKELRLSWLVLFGVKVVRRKNKVISLFVILGQIDDRFVLFSIFLLSFVHCGLLSFIDYANLLMVHSGLKSLFDI